MIDGYRIYDADAHVNVAQQMWEDLPKEFAARRPRPASGDFKWTSREVRYVPSN